MYLFNFIEPFSSELMQILHKHHFFCLDKQTGHCFSNEKVADNSDQSAH